MKKLLTALALIGLVAGPAMPAYAKSDNAATGKAVGHNDKGDRGVSASAPGQTGDTGKDNAPGQTKGE
jgi:hypothetical protein